jgi:hypothetical protein
MDVWANSAILSVCIATTKNQSAAFSIPRFSICRSPLAADHIWCAIYQPSAAILFSTENCKQLSD